MSAQTEKKTFIEVQPEFPGGISEMFKFLGKNIRYPANSREKGIMGTLYVGFVIDSTGKIENPIIKAQKLYRVKKKNIFSKPQVETVESDADLAKECLRIISIMPVWKAGTQDGKPVRVAYTLPIKFSID